jgi:arylsulfatase A
MTKNNFYMKKIFLIIFIGIGLNSFCQTNKPNIVIIYADDMGFSDIGHFGQLYNITSSASTPNMDTFASESKVFTNAHSSSAVCTPSRYSLLTGIYNWRTLPQGVSGAYGQSKIPEGNTTIAEYLKSKGYSTAAFGKWHLGGNIAKRNGGTFQDDDIQLTNPNLVDWEKPIEGHALDHGFDVFRGKHNAINRAPHLYVNGDRFQYYDTNTGQYRDALNTDAYFWLSPPLNSREGLGDPSYDVFEVEPRMISQVEQYIQEKSNQPEPFFAYVALNSPHKPWVVTPDFVGTEGFPYGDFMREVDHRVGRILNAIKNNDLENNTIVIITSDNGPETTAMKQSIDNGRDSNGPFRGVKRDSWDGGTRVPYMIRWPGVVEGGTTTNQLTWQGDIFQTIADYLGDDLANDVAPDAISILPILNGNLSYLHRDAVVSASYENQLSIKANNGWKLIDGTGGGGNSVSYDRDNIKITSAIGHVGGSPKQLFYLPTDIGEHYNIQSANPGKVTEMLDALDRIRYGNPGFTNYGNMILTMNTEAYVLDDTTIPLPFVSGAYDVDFGNDGTFELINQQGAQIIDITSITGFSGFTGGDITIAIRPNSANNPNKELQIQFFDKGIDNISGTADDVFRESSKLTRVDQWGSIVWTSMEGAFGGCNNMTFVYDIDIPNLSKVKNMSHMFFRATSFNSSLSSWDVSCTTDMSQMFYEASSFNQDIGKWDVSEVSTMHNMFFNASTFSSANYDALLMGWSQQGVQSGVVFRAPPVSYCSGEGGKNILVSAPNSWVINGDLGLNCPNSPDITFTNLLVFLQGPYRNAADLMDDNLRSQGLIPSTSPYGDGTTVDPLIFNTTGSNAIVDWVLVELRDPFDITNVLYSKAALLQRDGDVVGVDGTSPLMIAGISSSSYYVSVNHRNHISISSNVPIDFTNPPSVDLTSISNVRGATNAMKHLEGDIYGMFSGDINNDGIVLTTDYNQTISFLNSSGYLSYDADMDGSVLTTDLNLFIITSLNVGKQF